MRTIKHLGGTQPNLPSAAFFSPAPRPSSSFFFSALLTDDYSVGGRRRRGGRGLTGKGIISHDNHRRTQAVNNKLAAENKQQGRREEKLFKGTHTQAPGGVEL